MTVRLTFVGGILLFFISVAQAQKSSYQGVEQFSFNWNGRGKVNVILESPPVMEGGGTYTRVRIQLAGQPEFRLEDEDGLIATDDKEAWIPKHLLRESKQQSKSRRILLLQQSNGDHPRTDMFLVGYSYASAPGALYIIRLPKSGPPRLIFRSKEMGLQDFADLDGDGTRELVGYPCLHQSMGDVETYDPFEVYKLVGEKSAYSLELSAKYNRQHYVWAGRGCSEKIGVKSVNGKRRVVKIE